MVGQNKQIVEYMNDDGLYIIRLPSGKYYYGNGKNINAFGISANQFLRFNPYLEYVEGIEPSDVVKKWLDSHKEE